MYQIQNLPGELTLGRQREQNVTTFVFNISAWLEQCADVLVQCILDYFEFKKGGGSLEETVKLGSKGSAVTKLQTALLNAGYKITIDGVFGKETDEVVRSYQKENGLKVDGIVGLLLGL